MSSAIELTRLKPLEIDNDEEVRYFEMIVNTYAANYFNYADTPLIELYARTYKEINHLYAALSLAGSVANEKNKQYEKISRLIDTKINQLNRLGTSLRINPQQRRAPATHRQDNLEDTPRTALPSTRENIANKDIWE